MREADSLAVLAIKEGDLLVMKKPHPCGGNTFRVLRTGSDIRILCTSCQRDVTVPRVKLEKNVKAVEGKAPSAGEEKR